MIPTTEVLEEFYGAHEVAALEDLRKVIARIKDKKQHGVFGRAMLRKLWDDELTYIEKTHFIKTKEGSIKQLRLNYAQKRLYDDVIRKSRSERVPIRAIILKARQLGFSTFIQCWQYEQCDREANRSALTINYDQDSSTELFQKTFFTHTHMFFPRETRRSSSSVLEFKGHDSIATIRTAGNLSAGRSNTHQYLHASEIPMWPDAGETFTSAASTVPEHVGTAIFLESTAKGAVGEFYDEWGKAAAGGSDFIPFFAPWFWDPDYSTPLPSADHEAAFGRTLNLAERRLADAHGLTLAQLNWRRRTIRSPKCQGSEAKFRQEYPSSPKEAFLTTGSPVFSADAIADLEQNTVRPLWVGNIHLEIVEA